MADDKHEEWYLKPYSDEEMLLEALHQYAQKRHAFAKALSQKGYRTRADKKPTKDEMKYAIKCAEQADRLVAYARERVESPIIQLQ